MLLHEGEGLVVTIETKSGHVYRGTMETVEDSMNTGMKNVTVIDPFGRRSEMERVFIRGGQVLFVIFPDMLKMAPMFERLRKASAGLSTAGGLGRGRLQAIQERGALASSCAVPRVEHPFPAVRAQFAAASCPLLFVSTSYPFRVSSFACCS